MTELKTLKDLQIGTLHLEEGEIKLTDVVSHKMLRQEVTRWIKEDRKFAEGLKEGSIKEGDIPRAFEILMIKWKERFNIKEEDLK